MPLGLSDSQLQSLMMSAGDIPQEKRSLFLQRVNAMLTLKGRRFTDRDLAEVLELARVGLGRRSALREEPTPTLQPQKLAP
jgi:hypothetical protein